MRNFLVHIGWLQGKLLEIACTYSESSLFVRLSLGQTENAQGQAHNARRKTQLTFASVQRLWKRLGVSGAIGLVNQLELVKVQEIFVLHCCWCWLGA